jgi:hypothetical protein
VIPRAKTRCGAAQSSPTATRARPRGEGRRRPPSPAGPAGQRPRWEPAVDRSPPVTLTRSRAFFPSSWSHTPGGRSDAAPGAAGILIGIVDGTPDELSAGDESFDAADVGSARHWPEPRRGRAPDPPVLEPLGSSLSSTRRRRRPGLRRVRRLAEATVRRSSTAAAIPPASPHLPGSRSGDGSGSRAGLRPSGRARQNRCEEEQDVPATPGRGRSVEPPVAGCA